MIALDVNTVNQSLSSSLYNVYQNVFAQEIYVYFPFTPKWEGGCLGGGVKRGCVQTKEEVEITRFYSTHLGQC